MKSVFKALKYIAFTVGIILWATVVRAITMIF